jgi:hypothetical protein
MTGDARKRFCESCSLNVYNVSEMTRTEAEGLIAASEGRFCARIYRRQDGTVITRDCPVGLRSYRKRVASFAGAALSIVLGLFSVGYGQCKVKADGKTISAKKLDIGKIADPKGESGLRGTITDQNGAVVPNFEIRLLAENAKLPVSATSNGEGIYSFASLKPGKYTLAISPMIGFKGTSIKDLLIEPGFVSELNIVLEPGEGTTVLVGVVGFDPLIDSTSTGGTTVITREMLDRKP